MTIEEKNQLIKEYINNIKNDFEKNGHPIPEETINTITNKYINSDKTFDEIKSEIDALVKERLEELRKIQERIKENQKERQYALNDLFNCRISNNTLHIHVVPDSVKEDIKESGGMKQYLIVVEEKLDDAMKKIANILKDPNNQDINYVYAVSPTLKLSMLQEIFEKKGFKVGYTTDEKFIDMFNTNRIGEASISKEDFLKEYSTQEDKTNRFAQKFNYHTHTYRSGHSEYTSDEKILESAKQAGINMLGFSEHVPNPGLVFPDEDHRMLLSEVDEYIESINKLKQDNPNMTILSGFEAEFDPMKEAFLGEIREKVDYMILGQHFVTKDTQLITQTNNPNYPLEYAKMVCKGIESGIFDIIAHPDCFMSYRDTISDNNKELYKTNCIEASHMICKKAAEVGIPLEINMGDSLKEPIQLLNDGYLGCPHPLFWEVAKYYDVKVLKGIDAHCRQAFKDLDIGQQLINNIENLVSDKMLNNSYDPVNARQNNEKLQMLYKKHQENALTYETHMISQIVNETLKNVDNSAESENIANALDTSLNAIINRCVDGANKKEETIVNEISKINDLQELSPNDKKEKLKRKKQALNEKNLVLANQQRTLDTAESNVFAAMNMGCETKDEYKNFITQMTQYQSTNNKNQKEKIEQNISNYRQSKTEQKNNSQNVDKPKVLKKTNHTSSSGFVNAINLAIIIVVIIVVGIVIGYILYKSTIGS